MNESTILDKRVKRWPLITLSIFLLFVAAILGYGYVYSTNSAQEWRTAQNVSASHLKTMTSERDGLTLKVSELQSESTDLRTKLDQTTTDLNTATDRIRSLSDEKAQVGDSAAFLTEVLIMSQSVTAQMDMCIGDLQKLQIYLVDFQSYDAESLLKYAGGINDGCDKARDDSAALSRKLGG